MSPEEFAAWFWSRVDKSGGPDACWPWLGPRLPTGYGQVSFRGQVRATHRLAWELTNGPIPEGEGYHGMCVLHRCDNPPCCNANAHLWLGTAADNAADRDAKGRNVTSSGDRHGAHIHPERWARGAKQGSAKLTDAKAAAIRVDPRSLREIALDYDIGRSTAHNIKTGRTWRHVAPNVSHTQSMEE